MNIGYHGYGKKVLLYVLQYMSIKNIWVHILLKKELGEIMKSFEKPDVLLLIKRGYIHTLIILLMNYYQRLVAYYFYSKQQKFFL